MRQCVCGRSEAYPYCDNSHTRPKEKNINDKQNQEPTVQDN